MYFKWIVAQHENLAAKGILCVRVSLRFSFSFRWNKTNPAIFSQINSSINSKDFDIQFVIITSSRKYLNFSLNYHKFSKSDLFWTFLWAWYNMFASFFLLDVMTKTCSFICLCLLFRITSFDTFLGFSFLPPEPHIHWKNVSGKWKSRASVANWYILDMARSKIFQALIAHSPQHPAHNCPWTEDIYSFSNRPAHGPLNNWQTCLFLPSEVK